MKRGRRDTGLVHEAHSFGGNERRLLGGLGHDRIAGCQSSDDLPAKDRQWEIPWADAQEDGASTIAQRSAALHTE